MKYYKGIIAQCLDWRKSVFLYFDVKIPAKKLYRSKNYLFSDTDLAIWSAKTNKPSKSDYRKQESANREWKKKHNL